MPVAGGGQALPGRCEPSISRAPHVLIRLGCPMPDSSPDWPNRIDDPRVAMAGVVVCLAALLWWMMALSMDLSLPSLDVLDPVQVGPEAATGDGMARGSAPGDTRGSAGSMDGEGATLGPWPGLVGMWSLMMVAMMLPSMLPVLAIYTRLSAKEHAGARLAGRIALFAIGYLSLWIAFSAVAAAAQIGLAATPYFTAAGAQAGPIAAAVLLLVAGLYQLTPLKDACLDHCRHPVTFLIAHWRDGVSGAFPMGVHHGAYCVGCCAAFMGLMFVFGAANVLWMAALTVYFVLEKTLPRADVWGRIVGGLLIFAGLLQATRVLIA